MARDSSPSPSRRHRQVRGLAVALSIAFIVALVGTWLTSRVCFSLGVMTQHDAIARSGHVHHTTECTPGFITPRSCSAFRRGSWHPDHPQEPSNPADGLINGAQKVLDLLDADGT